MLTGTTFLVLGLYFIGSKKNIFHSTIKVSASFSNVQGLMPGNNVRFNGINVGTVSKVYAVSDTAIKVEFTIDKGETQYITKSSIASIGNDGLLGNKLVNLAPGTTEAKPVESGDVIKSLNPVQMDNAMRTLTATNDNLKVITDNLKDVSSKFNNNNSLWHLLTDSTLAENVRNAIVKFKLTGTNTAILTGDLSNIVKDVKAGKGSIGELLMDTTFSHKLTQTVVKIQSLSDSVALVSGDFREITAKIKNGNGAIGTLLTDTTFVHNLNKSMENIKNSSANFNENMEALHSSWPFKKYFRKKGK